MANLNFEVIRAKPGKRRINKDDVIREVGRLLDDVVSQVSLYPQQNPDSTYRRTGEYGRRWNRMGGRAIRLEGNDLVGTVSNNLSYAGFVGGLKTQDPRQTRVAANAGWVSVEDAANAAWRRHKGAIMDAVRGK